MRPALHFTAETGWINDPHGITFRNGEYHAFFQYVPGRTTWAHDCHWGHAVGPDLLSLRELPVAIAPGDDDEGIWTGSIVTGDDGGTRAFYTSTSAPDIGIGRIRVASPDDEAWLSWTKGPFVVDAPGELDIVAYRDPFVRREGAGWRMFVGAALRDGTAAALSYVSDDLRSWAYDGIALERSTTETDPVWMGALWECPQIFEIGDRAVMVSSVWDADVLHYAGYAVGRYADGRFDASSWGRLTWGDSYYAPSLFIDADGAPCLSFWMRGVADVDAGWASAHSVPYRLRLEGDALVAAPHPDVDRHRLPAVTDGLVPGVAADVEWRPGGGALTIAAGDVELARLHHVGDGIEIDRGGSTQRVPAEGDVRVIVDGPVLEVSSAAGLYGAAIDAPGDPLRITVEGGHVDVHPLA